MSDKLKHFITEHREQFDSGEPGKDLWNRIDAKMGSKGPARISSKWLSGLKYLGFGAGILAVVLYIILKNLNSSSADKPAMHTEKPSAEVSKVPAVYSRQTGADAAKTKETTDPSPVRNEKMYPISGAEDNTERLTTTLDTLLITEKNPTSSKPVVVSPDQQKTKNSTPELYIPPMPEKINSYTGTLYEGSSLCPVLAAYKFPGKVSGNKGKWNPHDNADNTTIRTRSCSLLRDEAIVKAVWLKGTTDKEITLLIKKGFKNIVLVKKDGRRLNPVAISHYYPGVGVISEYRGSGLSLLFKNKLELILLFKYAEEGDKIMIDGVLEAEVRSQP